MQDKSGIHRLKKPLGHSGFDTQMPKDNTGKTGSNGCWGRCRLGFTRHAKYYIHVGEWETPNVREQVYFGAQAWDAECRFCFRPKVKHEHRWGVGECKGDFPSLPSRPFAMRVKPSLANPEG